MSFWPIFEYPQSTTVGALRSLLDTLLCCRLSHLKIVLSGQPHSTVGGPHTALWVGHTQRCGQSRTLPWAAIHSAVVGRIRRCCRPYTALLSAIYGAVVSHTQGCIQRFSHPRGRGTRFRHQRAADRAAVLYRHPSMLTAHAQRR